MNDQQWSTLVSVIRGEAVRPLPTAFIIDSPWLPSWAGHTILDYFTDDRTFLNDNLKAIRSFPEDDLSSRILVGIRNVHGAFRFRLRLHLGRR